MIDDLKLAFPELTDAEAIRILLAFEAWYEPRTRDHEERRQALINFAGGWIAGRQEMKSEP